MEVSIILALLILIFQLIISLLLGNEINDSNSRATILIFYNDGKFDSILSDDRIIHDLNHNIINAIKFILQLFH